MRRCRSLLAWAALSGACVSYDPTGPHAEAIQGTWAAQLVTVLRDETDERHDTSAITLVLRDSVYRGRFWGFYRFTDSDSGLVAGTLYTDGRIEVSHFGEWPPFTQVAFLGRLYPSCELGALGPIYIVNGRLRSGSDSLLLAAETSLPCSGVRTPIALQLTGLRQP